MDEEKITLDAETLEKIQKAIEKISATASEEIVESEKPSFNDIKKGAEKFIENYKLFISISSRAQESIQRCKEERANLIAAAEGNQEEIDDIGQRYSKARAKVTEFLKQELIFNMIKATYEEGFILQEKLNKFLGQESKTIYVWVGSGGVPETYVLKPGEFLKQDVSSSGNVVMRYSAGKRALRSKDRGDQFRKSLEETASGSELEMKVQTLRDTYKEVKNRYDDNRRKGKDGKTIQGGYILWMLNNNWEGAYVNNMGSINEAYADALLTLLEKGAFIPNIPNDKEGRVGWLIEKVLQVTKLSGLLKGDVTIDEIEYAIKSNNATTLGLTQINAIAQQIVGTESIIDEQTLQKHLDEQMKKDLTSNDPNSDKGLLNRKLKTYAKEGVTMTMKEALSAMLSKS